VFAHLGQATPDEGGDGEAPQSEKRQRKAWAMNYDGFAKCKDGDSSDVIKDDTALEEGENSVGDEDEDFDENS